MPRCSRCDDISWVCKNRDDRPWREGEGGCTCGAGAPCGTIIIRIAKSGKGPVLQVANADNPPRLADDFEVVPMRCAIELASGSRSLNGDKSTK